MRMALVIPLGLAGLVAGTSASADRPDAPVQSDPAPTKAEASAGPGLIYLVAGEASGLDALLAEIEGDSTTRNALRYDTEGLVEEPSLAGGTMVDLGGRFQSVVVATLAADGRVRLDHVAAPAAEARGPVCSGPSSALVEAKP